MSATASLLFTIGLTGFLALLFLALGLLADFILPIIPTRWGRRWARQRRYGRAATYR